MPKAGYTHDVVLKTIDGATKVGLMLHRESTSLPGGYIRGDVDITAQQRNAEGQASYDSIDIENDLVYEQTSWHRGLGQATVVRRGDDDFRYGCGDGVMMHFEGSIVSGYLEDEADILIQNGRFERPFGESFGWSSTDANLTIGISADHARSGRQCCLMAVGAGSVAAVAQMEQDYGGDGSLFTGVQIVVTAYAKRVLGSGSLTLRVTGNSSGQTASTAVSSTDYTELSVTKTLTGDTSFTVSFRPSTDGDIWAIDDVALIPPGGTSWNDSPAELSGTQYAVYGRGVYQWNESDDAYYAVYLDASYNVECLRELDGNLYIGFGANQTYKYSSNGTTWSTASNASGDTGHASFLAVVRNANGDLALMKVINNQAALNAADPTDCNNWGANIQVGSSDKTVNNITEGNDTAYIGKGEGLYAYERSQQRFRNLAPEAVRFTSENNFKAFAARGSSVFTSLGGQSFWAMTDNGEGAATDWKEYSHLIKSHVYEGFSGDVEAIADDMTSMWVALADTNTRGFPYTFPFTFAGGSGAINAGVRVLVIRKASERSGDLVSHTLTTVRLSTVDKIARVGQSLFVLGSFLNGTSGNTEARVIRLRLPPDNEHPVRNASPAIRPEGIFCSQYIDFFYPDVDKTLAKITVTSKNLSANRQVEVGVKRDDDPPEDDNNWTVIDTLTTSPLGVAVASITSPYTFRRLRVRLRLISDQITQPIEVTGIVIHAVVNFKKSDEWTLEVLRRETRRRVKGLKARRRSGLSVTDRTTLETLAAEPFIYIEDIDGSTVVAKIDDIRDRYIDRHSMVNGAGQPDKVLTTTIKLHQIRRSS